jgi:tRNA A-37 threonylcarbamoyl transferase component Bud32
MNLDRVIAVRNDKTVFHDGNRCIKMFDGSYDKSIILREAMNQAYAKEIGINVPEVIGLSFEDDNKYIISEFIKGKTLENMMQEDSENANSYLCGFVKLQQKIQLYKPAGLCRLNKILAEKIVKVSIEDGLKKKLLIKLDDMPEQEALCHAEFNPSNVIMDPSGRPYIIDWSHLAVGNILADAAITYVNFIITGKDKMAESFLNIYCMENITQKKWLKEWIPIVAAARLAEGRSYESRLLLEMVYGIKD